MEIDGAPMENDGAPAILVPKLDFWPRHLFTNFCGAKRSLLYRASTKQVPTKQVPKRSIDTHVPYHTRLVAPTQQPRESAPTHPTTILQAASGKHQAAYSYHHHTAFSFSAPVPHHIIPYRSISLHIIPYHTIPAHPRQRRINAAAVYQ